MDRAPQHVRRRNEIRVEDEDELAAARFKAMFQRASFEARPVRPMDQLDIEPGRAQLLHLAGGDGRGLIGRIVQHLHLEQLARVIELRDRLQQPLDHVHLVVHGQLDRDPGQFLEVRQRHRSPIPVLQIQVDDDVAVQAVEGQAGQDDEITKCPNCVSQTSVHTVFLPLPAESGAESCGFGLNRQAHSGRVSPDSFCGRLYGRL